MTTVLTPTQQTFPVNARSNRRELMVQASIPTTTVGATSVLYSLDIAHAQGIMRKLDIAIAAGVDATISFYVFMQDNVAIGSIHTLVQLDSVTGDFHPTLDVFFRNMDSTQTTKIYLQVRHTAGVAATGVIPVQFLIET